MPASSTAPSDARPRFSPLALLRSVIPALDLAFGVEADPDLPDDLAALAARLQGESAGGFAVAAVAASEREPVPA